MKKLKCKHCDDEELFKKKQKAVIVILLMIALAVMPFIPVHVLDGFLIAGIFVILKRRK